MRIVAVIPARYRSTRLPGKPLLDLAGRPLVEHVYRRAREARGVERVLVATDDGRVAAAVRGFGGDCVMTSPGHPSGTDRVAEAVKDLEVDLVVNVQGDEPFLAPEAIEEAIEACRSTETAALATLRKTITDPRDLWDPNVVKVVTDTRGFALYFSRWPIPFVARATMTAADLKEQPQDRVEERAWFEHIGLYVYPKGLLLKLTALEPTPLERRERLEQLRALENGIPIRVAETERESFSVDTPEDLARARQRLAADPGASEVRLGRFTTT